VDDIQLEAIDTLLAFVVTDKVATARRVALVIEVRDKARAEGVFDLGPFVILPRPVVPEVVGGLAAAMRDANGRVRLDATYALGVLARPPADATATDALVAALRDPDAKVRVAAARVLGALRATGAGDALIEAVNDRHKDVRIAAMRALGDLREGRAIQALTEQFQFYGSGEFAVAALDGLARIAHPVSVPLFQQQLTSKDARLRRLSAEGLARTGQASLSLPTLESGLGDRDKLAALAVAYALQSVGRPSLDRLVEALGDPGRQNQAMLYLTELGRPIARPLGGYLQAPDPATRQAVAMVLGVIGGDDALAALERAKLDPDTEVARAAERAIARARMAR
jgi:HEAT repeat protein